MRKIRRHSKYYSNEEVKTAPGVCSLCLGNGRYKETYKHKAPIIRHCLLCDGTGKVKVNIRRKDGDADWREDLKLTLISESTDCFVCKTPGGGFTQFDKESYELY